jgi:Trk-type K+ transport system membrane component
VWSAGIIVGGLGVPLRARVYRWALGKMGCQRFIPREMVGEKWYVEAIVFMTIFVKVTGTILLFSFEEGNLNLLMAFFHVVSASTAGFNAIDISTLSYGSLELLMVLMFIGAAPNSWGGGGSKIFACVWVIYMIFLVDNTNSAKIRGYAREALVRIATAVGIILISTIVGIMFQPSLDPFKFLFEVVSGFTNTGFSLNLTTSLSTFNMFVIMFVMMIGKVGVITSLYALVPQLECKLTKSSEID